MSNFSSAKPPIDRTGQRVKISQSPPLIVEVTGWDSTLGMWEARYTTLPTTTHLREEMFAALAEAGIQELDPTPPEEL